MDRYSSVRDTLMTDVRRLVRNVNVPMVDIALQYGIPYRTVQEWCAGRRHPPEYVVRLLAYAMSSDYGDIINFIF